MSQPFLRPFPNQVGEGTHFIVLESGVVFKVALYSHGYCYASQGSPLAIFRAEASCGKVLDGGAEAIAAWVGNPYIATSDIWNLLFRSGSTVLISTESGLLRAQVIQDKLVFRDRIYL